MADIVDHIEALSANIGPRPVSTEEEHQASCYVAQQLTDAGLEVDMDEFATPSGVNWPFCIAFVLMIVGTALSGLGMFFDGVSTAFLAVGLVLLVIGAIIYFAEHSDHPLLSNAFNRGVSQNVVAKYVPSSLARENRRRKVIIVAHVDTVRSELQANPALVNYFPTYTRVLYYTTIGLLALLVIRLFPIPWPDLVDLILWILSLVGCLVPLAGVVCIVAHKLLPYVEGANDNASGVAVMLDVANHILDPQERERLAQERSGGQSTDDAAEEDEDTLTPQPVVHDAETAAAAGVVAEGAEIEYAADAREADADTPDATKVMPALDEEAAPAAEQAEAESAPSSSADDAVPDEGPEETSVLEFPHPVSEAAIGSATPAPAAAAEQVADEDEEVVDADYEDAAVSEVNAAEQKARSAALDEAQTVMQPRPHPKHEPESAPKPEPEPEPDPSTAGMPAWYVAARKQAERERSASDETADEEPAVARSRFADIPLEGVSDLDASEEVSDAEAEVEEEEAPEQPLEEPPSAYAETDEEAPAPASEETHEEAPAAEETHEEAAAPTEAAEHEEVSAPTDAAASAQPAQSAEAAEPAAAQPAVSEAAEPPAAEEAAPSEPAAAEPAAEAAPSEAATPAEEEKPAAPAAAEAAEPSVAESAASAPTPAEQAPTEAPAPQPAETPAAEQSAATPAAEKAESDAPATAQAEAPADTPAAAAAQPAVPTAAAAAEKSTDTEAAPEEAAEAEPAAAAAPDTETEEPASPTHDAMSEAARELPTRIPAIGSSGSVSSERRVSQLRSELESSIAGNAKGSAPVARTHKETKDAAPARRKPTARRVTEAFQPTKAVEDRDEGFTGVTQAAAVSSTYEDTPQAGATQEPEFDPFAPSSMPETAAPAAPQHVSPSASSQFPTVSPSASSQFPTVSPSASSQFPTVSPSASSQFPTVSPSASTQFPTVPASAAVNPSDFGAPAAPTDYAAPANPAPAPNTVGNQADYAAPATSTPPTPMPTEPEPVEEYATLDPEIAVPQSRFRDALDGVAGAFGRIGRRNRRNQDQDLDGGAWTSSGESDGGNGDEDEDIGWKGGAYYAGEDDDEMQDEAAFDDEDAFAAPAEDSSDELHPGRSGSFDPSAIDSARARAAQIRESIVTMTEHDLLDKEVWFVALGASSANNRGMRNFLDLHATELRGSLIINLEAVGAGDICYVDLEGRGKVERADRRLQTLVRKASKDLGEVMSAETLTWRDTDATPAMRAGLRAMTIMGFDGVAPTAWHWHTDTTLILEDDALDYTTRLILKMIENS